MQTTHTISVRMTSHMTDALWRSMFSEIEETVEQIACDYAAACDNDEYRVDVEEV